MPLYSYYILHWFVSQSTLYLSEEYKTRCQRVLKNSTDLQDKISGVRLQQVWQTSRALWLPTSSHQAIFSKFLMHSLPALRLTWNSFPDQDEGNKPTNKKQKQSTWVEKAWIKRKGTEAAQISAAEQFKSCLWWLRLRGTANPGGLQQHTVIGM